MADAQSPPPASAPATALGRRTAPPPAIPLFMPLLLLLLLFSPFRLSADPPGPQEPGYPPRMGDPTDADADEEDVEADDEPPRAAASPRICCPTASAATKDPDRDKDGYACAPAAPKMDAEEAAVARVRCGEEGKPDAEDEEVAEEEEESAGGIHIGGGATPADEHAPTALLCSCTYRLYSFLQRS